MNIITFPNLDIGPMVIRSVAFNLFGRDVAWYGIIITTAIILAVLYVMIMAKKENLLEDDIYDYALIVVFTAIIFARLYYVVFDPEPRYKSFIDVIAIWNGGLAIYGGIIGGAIASFLVSKWKNIHFARFADMICPAVMLGQAIGRWGNFMNGEAYGSVTKFDFFFASFDISSASLSSPFLMNVSGTNAHPTFLYESLWNIVGFLLIVFFINKRRKFAGMNTFFYFAWYGFGRMFIEGLRTDSLYIPGSSTLRVSQLIALVTFVGSLIAIAVFYVRSKNNPFDVKSPVYYGKRLKKLQDSGVLTVDDTANEKNESEMAPVANVDELSDKEDEDCG